MTYDEMNNLINEFGLKKEGFRISFNNFTVATINYRLINAATGKIAYRLDFITSNISTMKYEIAKKATVKRILIIKDVIVANKLLEIEKDFM